MKERTFYANGGLFLRESSLLAARIFIRYTCASYLSSIAFSHFLFALTPYTITFNSETLSEAQESALPDNDRM